MDDKMMEEKPNSRYILSVFASRVGAELERMNAEELLRNQTEELIQVNKMKDKFLKITAHDLKNPFTNIMGFSDLLRKKIKRTGKDKIQKMVNIIDDSVKSSYAILENLSDWSKIHRDVMLFEPVKTDLAEISASVADYYRNYVQSKEVILNNNIQKNTFAYADEYMVNSIFRNLVSNAIKFTGKKGRVTIDAVIKDKNIEIVISDTGTGIKKSEMNQLFKVKDKDIKEGTAGERGSGLGLIICKDFTERNKGRLSIDSVVDKGTTVRLTLPQFKD
jgi:signal transduction histidine kinase